MNPIYITLESEKIRVLTRGGYKTKKLCERIGSTHSPISARLLQAIVARSNYGDEDESDYNFHDYPTLSNESENWSYTEEYYTTLEEAEQLEQELDRSFISSDDRYDLQNQRSDFCFVEHIWTKK